MKRETILMWSLALLAGLGGFCVLASAVLVEKPLISQRVAEFESIHPPRPSEAAYTAVRNSALQLKGELVRLRVDHSAFVGGSAMTLAVFLALWTRERRRLRRRAEVPLAPCGTCQR